MTDYSPDFSIIDKTARRVYAPAIRASDRIHQGLDQIQQRNKERQDQLKAGYDRQTAQINSLLGK